MTRVYGFLLGALIASAGAYFTRAGGGMEFWLFVIGAGGFLLAAAGEYFKVTQGKA